MFDAVKSGDIGTVRKMAGKDPRLVSQRYKNEATLLHWAVRWSAKEGGGKMIETLIEMGADVNARDIDGEAPIHWAVDLKAEKMERVASLLILGGADINAQDKNGDTLLHDVVILLRKNRKIIDFLMKKGADPRIRNNMDETPIDWAMEEENDEMADYMESFSK